MGCAGSKPHSLLPSSTQHHQHHVNSPQKGFIIFNEKTIEYIKAYENELRDIIKTRSEQKLFANKTLKLKNNEKLVAANGNKSANSGGNGVTSGGEETTPKLNKKNGNATTTVSGSHNTTATTISNDTSILNTTISNINEKESAIIDSAVDSVLKYAINDFDIENFKSSNHLSMKQIRKDILKKQSNATPVLKANDHAFYKKALNTAIDEFGALMQERFIQINEFRVSDTAAAADKCLQNEHDQSSSTDNGENKSKISSTNHKADDNSEEDVNQQHTLTLREALEIARHNFYKGKLSMVSMTKSGGYIVKEVKEDQNQGTNEEMGNNNELPTSSSAQTTSTTQTAASEVNNLLPKTVTMFDTQTQKTSKIAFAPQINIEDVDISATFKIIETDLGSNIVKNDNFSTRSIDGSNNSSSQNTSPAKETVNDNVVVESKEITNEERQQMEQEETRQHIIDLQYLRTQFIDSQETIKTLFKDTINSIVKYSSKTTTTTTTTNSVPQDSGDIVKENLEKCIHVIEILNNDIDERDYELIDKKLIKNVVNLGYINKEFLDYLNILQRSNSDGGAYSQEINGLQTEAKELNELLNKVPKNLFVVSGVSSDVTSKVDVKRGIAFSILNMGEVLAKTIDYYSLPHPEVLLENQPIEPKPQEVQQQPQEKQVEVASYEDNASAKLSTNIEDYCNKQFYDLNNIQNTPQPPVELKMQAYNNNNDQQNESITSMDIDNKNNQNDYTSTSISSPSDLLSSLSSSSEASPSKNDIDHQSKKLNGSLNHEITNEDASATVNNNIEKNTVQDDMAYLVEQMQKSLTTQIDCIIANNGNVTENGHHSVVNANDQSLSPDQPTTSTVTTVNSERQDQATSSNGTCKKRLSIDEELLNQLETVDKKVKYVSETCSENDDDDDDEINNDYDNDNERLFNPKPTRRPPISNNNEIHEELKQISNVIQDLVQSINGHNSTTASNGNGTAIEESTSTFSEVILSPVDNNTQQQVEIHTTTITTTTSTNNNQDNSNNINIDHLPQMIPDRKSISSISSNSSIPIRTKFLTKQKATALDDELSTTASPAKMNLSIDVNDSFGNDTMENSTFSEQTTTTPPEIKSKSKSNKKKNNNNHNNNNNFKSKLPVKK